VIFLLTLACAGLASRDIAAEIQSARAERRVTRRIIENFTPIDQNGAPFTINNLAGKVMVVAFADIACVDVCPLITAALRQMQIALTPKSAPKFSS